MRKLFTILSIALMAFAITSCRGPQGPKGEDGLVYYKVIDLQINQNEWGYSNHALQYDNNYFYAAFDVPELTTYIYNNGIIKLYREYDYGTDKATQLEIPSNHYVEKQDEAGNWLFYTEYIDYEFTTGKLTVFYTRSDFNYEEDLTFTPEAMHFRLIMMW